MSILKNLVRKSVKHNDKLNILSFFYDGKFDIELLKTGHNFYGVKEQSYYEWPAVTKDVYDNLFFLKNQEELKNLEIDLVLFNNRLHTDVQAVCHFLHAPGLIIDHEPRMDNFYIRKKLIESCPFQSVATSKYVQNNLQSKLCIPYLSKKINGQYEKDIDILITGNFAEQDLFIIGLIKRNFPTARIFGNNQLPYSERVNTYSDYQNLFKRAKVFINLPQQGNIPYELVWAYQNDCVIVTPDLPIFNDIIQSKDGIYYYKSPEDIVGVVESIKIDIGQMNREKQENTTFLEQWNDIFESMRYEIYK